MKNPTITTVRLSCFARNAARYRKPRSTEVKIDYRQGKGIALYFPVSELPVALGILRAIYSHAKLEFVAEAIKDLEDDLLTRILPMVNHNHLCCSCYRMLDDRDPDSLHIVTETDEVYKHRTCPPLKENRPN